MREQRVHRKAGSGGCSDHVQATFPPPLCTSFITEARCGIQRLQPKLTQKALNQESENLILPPAHLCTVDKVIIVSEKFPHLDSTSFSKHHVLGTVPRPSPALIRLILIMTVRDRWYYYPHLMSHSEVWQRQWACPFPSGCVRSALSCYVSSNVLGVCNEPQLSALKQETKDAALECY